MPTKKFSGRKYSKKAGTMVAREMREMKRGTLKSGRSGKKVKSRKQAIAINRDRSLRSSARRRQGSAQEFLVIVRLDRFSADAGFASRAARERNDK